MRLLAALALLAWLGLAHASTYAFRSDPYSWETTANTITSWDGSCTGYPVDDDQATLNFSGGFTFTFAGVAYSSVRVLSNGMLQFGADDGFQRSYINTAMPAAAPGSYSRKCTNATPTNVLMGYWMDLKPYSASYGGCGTVGYEQKGTAPNRYFVVSWNAVCQYNTTTPYTFEIILFENGEFKYQYNSANTTGSNATIGVQVSSSDYTQYAYNTGYASAGTAIRWYIPSNTPALIAEYRMDETSWNGTVGEVQDNSPNGHDGVRVGNAQTVANGKVCRGEGVPANTSAATIDAVDTELDVNSAIGPQTGSLDFWYRSNVAWNGGTAAMLADATTSSSRPFYLQRDGTGVLRLVVSDPGGNTASVSSPAQSFAANTWVHVGAIWNLQPGTGKTQLRLYLNGAQVASATATTAGTLDNSLGTLFLGDNRSTTLPAGATGNSANGTLDEVRVYNYDIGAAGVATDMAATHACPSSLDHLELRGSASGLTCTPTTFSLVACQDAACSAPYTGGVTGSMTPSGGSAVWQGGNAFSIPSGSSAVNVSLQLTTASTVTLGVSGLAPTNNGTNLCTLSGVTSCSYTASDSGLLISVPPHAAESSATMTVSAVKKADNSTACTPAFASVSKPLSFSCAYVNPASGTLPLRVAGAALNAAGNVAAACDGSSKSVTLAFNASGVATTTLQYADVGQMQINGSYSGSGNDAGLTMSGNTQFIVAPASFAVTGPSGKQRAGIAFSASVTARNSAGNTTPNFGRESPAENAAVTFALYQPVGGSAGGFSGTLGAFSNGTASGSNFLWTEVGTGDLVATLSSAPPGGSGYLGSGLSATGSTSAGGASGAVGPFVPHHFVTLVTPKCNAGANPFTYFDQPFAYSLQAMNGLSTATVTSNYDGGRTFTVSGASRTVAQAVSLSDASALGGSFAPSATVPASAFSGGIASGSVAYGGFATKLNSPGTLSLRATEPVDGVNSSGYAEGQTAERSGRLRLFNAFGSEKSALAVTLQAEFWNGSAWAKNGDDSCTTLASANVAFSNVRGGTGGVGGWTTTASPASIALAGGGAIMTLAAPTPAGNTGSVDIALDLGSTATDQSCLASHPAVTGAGLAWLRSQNGSCASTWDRDPSARASFGIYSPESKKTVHAREIF